MSNRRQLRSSTAQGIKNALAVVSGIYEDSSDDDSDNYDEVPQLHDASDSDAADGSSDGDAPADAGAVVLNSDDSSVEVDADERADVARIEKEEAELHAKFVASSDDEPQDGSDDYSPDGDDAASSSDDDYDSEESDSEQQ